jgi:chromosome segregation ATPase
MDELKKAQDQKAVLEEQLEHAKHANEKHLIELATHREKARDMALDLDESKAEVDEVSTNLHFWL